MKFNRKKAFRIGTYIIYLVFASIIFYSCDKPSLGPTSTGSISGVVKDYNTNKTINNVNITTSPPTSSVVTDSTGHFELKDLASGNYSINASKYGYTDNSVTIKVSYGSMTEAVIFMKPATINGSNLKVNVINWANRIVTSDSVYADVQYKVTNVSSKIVNNYNIYFRIHTPNNLFEYEAKGGTLNVDESKISNFSQYLRSNKADSVSVEGTWSN